LFITTITSFLATAKKEQNLMEANRWYKHAKKRPIITAPRHSAY
jgi:hypothetical protein